MSVDDHGPGLIAVPCGNIGRYREFDMNLAALEKPARSHVDYRMGANIAASINKCILMMDDEDEWFWLMNDDHVFSKNLLVNLLDRDVDVVIPLCCSRAQPYIPVILDLKENAYRPLGWEVIKDKTGLVDGCDWNLGGAGLLVKRHVFEKIPQPWFECGKTNPEVLGEDVYFYEKLRKYNIKYYLDLDNYIGHMTHAAIWPTRNEKGAWCVSVQTP